MEDLLQSQIQESCKLALPEGLQDLCYDISREVLRAQPKDLIGFITNYLSCLLVTRENLKVAAKIIEATGCRCSSQGTTLPDDLRNIGIEEPDIEELLEVVDNWFESSEKGETVKETALLSELMNKTTLTPDQLPEVVEAIRNAYLRMQDVNDILFESSSNEDLDEVDRAAKHTLHLYRKTEPTEIQYHQAATRIQAAYRAYGVRREKQRKQTSWAYAPKIEQQAKYIAREFEEESAEEEEEYGSVDYDGEMFKDGEVSNVLSRCSGTTQGTSEIEQLYRENHVISTVSSASLAGSMVKLPKHKPYTVQESVKEIVEEEVVRIEKESSVFDYTKLRDEFYEADDEFNLENDTPKPPSLFSESDHSLADHVPSESSFEDDDSVCEFVETVDGLMDKVDSKSDFDEVEEDPDL